MINIDKILRALNKHKIRATYGAVGKVLNIPAIAVGSRLGSRRPEASWVVSSKTGRPTNYSAEDCHPDLFRNDQIIGEKSELVALIADQASSTEYRKTGSRVNRLIGLDLAWNCEKNGSGLAIGRLDGSHLVLEELHTGIRGLGKIMSAIVDVDGIFGIAIDAPLIIKNKTGSRPCEKELNRVYGSRWAGCHPTNLGLHANSAGPILAEKLERAGFRHLGIDKPKWQIECYPHPAIIQIFGLDKRLKYKKKENTSWDEVRLGQSMLGKFILSLENRTILSLSIPAHLRHLTDPARIANLDTRQLKDNEDGLDAIICLYVAARYASGLPVECYGDGESGYIIVPATDE